MVFSISAQHIFSPSSHACAYTLGINKSILIDEYTIYIVGTLVGELYSDSLHLVHLLCVTVLDFFKDQVTTVLASFIFLINQNI